MSCIACTHYQLGGKCPAYPDRIPLSIISGELLHLTVLPNQQAAIVFEYGPNKVNGGMLEEPDDYGRDYPLLPGFTPTLGLLSRAKGKAKGKAKKKKCEKGQVCGLSCIAKTKTCIADMTLAQLMEHNRAKRAERRAKAQAKKAAATGGAVKPSSEVKTYQEAIERGKAIAANFEKTVDAADIKKLNDIQSEYSANWDELFKLNGMLRSTMPFQERETIRSQKKALLERNKQIEADLPLLRKKVSVDYDGLIQQMKSMSGVDSARAKQIVSTINFDGSIGKPRKIEGKKYQHDIDQLKRDTEEYLMMVGDKVKVDRVYQHMTRSGLRAGAGSRTIGFDDNHVNIGSPGKTAQGIKATLFHELAHHIEFESPQKALIAMDWVKSRATGDLTKLSKLVKYSSYGAKELAYPDDFIRPYVGKSYKNFKHIGEKSTEVLSMGLEHFSSPDKLSELYTKDKDHFYLTLGLVAG